MNRFHGMQTDVAVNTSEVREVQTALRLSGRNQSIVPVVGQDCDDVFLAIAVNGIRNIEDEGKIASVLGMVSIFASGQLG